MKVAGIRLSVLLTSLLVCSALVPIAAAAADGTDDYVVMLKDSIADPGSVGEAQVDQRDGDLGFVYRSALKGYSAELPEDEVASLRADPRVLSVTRDVRLKTESQPVPTGVGRIFAAANPSLGINGFDDVRVDADVAVIDTGIDYKHPDLNVAGRINCVPKWEEDIEECVEGGGIDGDGHGTHVAGTIGALDNGEGVVGVAPGVRLWAVRVLNNGGEGEFSWVLAGIDWVATHAETIEVANMSLGVGGELPAGEAALKAAREAGVVMAVAAGNQKVDSNTRWPARSPDVITVSAIGDYDGRPGGAAPMPWRPSCGATKLKSTEFQAGKDDTQALFTSPAGSNWGSGVEIAAPGVCIYSTAPGGGYWYLSGTSMASPHVAGAAALLAAKDNPNSKADVEAIADTLIDNGNYNWEDTSGDGIKEPLLDVSNRAVFNLPVGRPPAFEAEMYPVTVSGTAKPLTVEMSGAELYCEAASLQGEIPGQTATSLSFTSGFSECELFGAMEAEVDMNSCSFVFGVENSGPPYSGTTSIACSKAGDTIEITEPLNTCSAYIYPTTGAAGSATYANSGGGGAQPAVGVQANLTGIKYTVVKNSVFCPVKGGTFTNGKLKAKPTLKASFGGPVGFFMIGEEVAPHAPNLESDYYPTDLTARQDSYDPLIWQLGGGESYCEEGDLAGASIPGPATSFAFSEGEFGECDNFGLLESTVDLNSCSIGMEIENSGPPYSGAIDIACSVPGDKIEFVDPYNICTVSVPAQSGAAGSATYETVGIFSTPHVEVDVNMKNIEHTVVKTSPFCPLNKGTAKNGSLSGTTTLYGRTEMGSSVAVFLSGEEI